MCSSMRIGLAVSAILLSLAAHADELPSPLRLDALIARVREKNPELRARRDEARAAAARPRAVGQLEDPSISFEWWQQPIDFATVPLMVTLRQPLPWPGTLAARRAAARTEGTTARDRISETERRLEAEVKQAFLDAALADRSLALNQQDRALLAALVQVATARYQAGKTPQAEVLSAQAELLAIDNDRLDLERAREVAAAKLDELLARPADAPIPPTELPQGFASLPPERELDALALAERPEVKVARDALSAARARLEVARRTTNPELAVWAGYMVNVHGVDTFTAGVSSTLPVFSARRRSAEVDEVQAEVAARSAEVESAERKATLAVRTALLQLESARRHEELHEVKLIPLAELSLRSAEAAYQSGQVNLATVLAAARMVRDHHLAHIRYLVEYQRRLADLEQAVGRDFSVGGRP